MTDGLARVTPSPQDYVPFQSGDVLGFYVESANPVAPTRPPNGVVLQTSPSAFTSETVWFATISPSLATSSHIDCPYSVGSVGILNTQTFAAPVLSIATSKCYYKVMILNVNRYNAVVCSYKIV